MSVTPDSPAAVLWRGSEGGLNGSRARARLAVADENMTVAQLCDKTADDITDIPRAGTSVLAEVRRALTANGLHLAGERPPSPAAIERARQLGQRPAERRKRKPEEPAPVSREDFAALVKDLRAELDEADKDRRRALLSVPRGEHPRSFAGRPWAWRTVGQQGVSDVTGYSPNSVKRYKAQAREAHDLGTATHRTMPMPDPAGRWVIGDLALWMATRDEAKAAMLVVDDETAAKILADIRAGHAANGERLPYGRRKSIAADYGVSGELVAKFQSGEVPARDRTGPVRARREKPKIRADDDEVAAFLAARIARTTGYVTAATLLAEARAAGLPAAGHQLRRLLPPVRAAEARRRRKPTGPERARGESLRPDGLLYGSEVAEDWAITRSALALAHKRGDIRAAKTEGRRPLYDPARLRVRTDRRRTPVDVTHPLARLEPGDPGYGERKA